MHPTFRIWQARSSLHSGSAGADAANSHMSEFGGPSEHRHRRTAGVNVFAALHRDRSAALNSHS
jgi:hypothetical protein